jgi:hypothetical protein
MTFAYYPFPFTRLFVFLWIFQRVPCQTPHAIPACQQATASARPISTEGGGVILLKGIFRTKNLNDIMAAAVA